MGGGKVGWNVVIFGLARMILRDREQRRRLLFKMLLSALGLMAVGLWAIDGWLESSPLRFLIWWAVCAMVTCAVILFALYDALAVVREERSRLFGNDEDK
jgi:hypothetical protein